MVNSLEKKFFNSRHRLSYLFHFVSFLFPPLVQGSVLKHKVTKSWEIFFKDYFIF